ncbi:MAG: coenzyme F420-0:L-glutamate ligase [Sporichthyaceae bacterium]|nr:coenzyme F420-0:L-glutamate ligase [Sporichthyaceae bacterium]
MIAIHPVPGLPDITAGADLAGLIADAAGELVDGDIVVVTSKVVAKAEGRVLEADDREAAITAESVRLVARRGPLRIVQTRHGLVLAAAGVDASNVEPGRIVLLPVDPDASARRLRAELQARAGGRVAVLVTDTVGRPWRQGLTDIAIGCAGLDPLIDLRGGMDGYGRVLDSTVTAIADELAAAAELVKGKLAGIPVAVVRGLGRLVTVADGPGAQALIRPPAEDMFRFGSAEAVRVAVADRNRVTEFAADPVPAGLIDAAIAAASTDRAGFIRVEPAAGAGGGPALALACLAGSTGSSEREAGLLDLGAAIADLQLLLAADDLGSARLPLDAWQLADPAAIPAGWEPITLLAIGYPAQNPR